MIYQNKPRKAGRRLFLIGGLAGVLLRPRGSQAAPVSEAEVTSLEDRLAKVVSSQLSQEDFHNFLYDAKAKGWCSEARPPLEALRTQIALDFRSNDTVLIQRVMLSRTEVTWLLSFDSGVA